MKQNQNTDLPHVVKQPPLMGFRKLANEAIIPTRQTLGSSGYDLHAYLPKSISLEPGDTIVIPTGISIASMPSSIEAQIRSRSGLAAKHCISVLNSPGTIDSDYEGELKVILHNSSPNPLDRFKIKNGDRIAQVVFSPVFHIEGHSRFVKAPRGEGGLGSTGV